ncbi:MAG TPA: guanylate kinase [Planctomycetota bacterium]|nr:guanylate kinase [Planctomycetota bacterium]
MPHQPVEDGGGPLRSSARGARQPVSPLDDRSASDQPSRSDALKAASTGRPRLFVVTGPSGAGKGTLIRELLARRPELEAAISATTRPVRPGERDGREYYFLSEEDFDRRVAADEFLEHVVYVSGQRYGTLNAEVDRILGSGRSCVLELETEGAKNVKRRHPDAVTVFVAAPSFAELERRLRERATDSAGEIGERLALARRQMDEAPDFDVVVVNDEVERAVAELEQVVAAAEVAGGR